MQQALRANPRLWMLVMVQDFQYSVVLILFSHGYRLRGFFGPPKPPECQASRASILGASFISASTLLNALSPNQTSEQCPECGRLVARRRSTASTHWSFNPIAMLPSKSRQPVIATSNQKLVCAKGDQGSTSHSEEQWFLITWGQRPITPPSSQGSNESRLNRRFPSGDIRIPYAGKRPTSTAQLLVLEGFACPPLELGRRLNNVSFLQSSYYS